MLVIVTAIELKMKWVEPKWTLTIWIDNDHNIMFTHDTLYCSIDHNSALIMPHPNTPAPFLPHSNSPSSFLLCPNVPARFLPCLNAPAPFLPHPNDPAILLLCLNASLGFSATKCLLFTPIFPSYLFLPPQLPHLII